MRSPRWSRDARDRHAPNLAVLRVASRAPRASREPAGPPIAPRQPPAPLFARSPRRSRRPANNSNTRSGVPTCSGQDAHLDREARSTAAATLFRRCFRTHATRFPVKNSGTLLNDDINPPAQPETGRVARPACDKPHPSRRALAGSPRKCTGGHRRAPRRQNLPSCPMPNGTCCDGTSA